MGRSVATYGEFSMYINYDFSDFEFTSCWTEFYDRLNDVITDRYTSFDCVVDDNKWEGSEGRVIAENEYCSVVVSSYYNICSINLVILDSAYEYSLEGLATSFISKIQDNFVKLFKDAGYDVLMRQGTFSNGCSVYQKV